MAGKVKIVRARRGKAPGVEPPRRGAPGFRSTAISSNSGGRDPPDPAWIVRAAPAGGVRAGNGNPPAPASPRALTRALPRRSRAAGWRPPRRAPRRRGRDSPRRRPPLPQRPRAAPPVSPVFRAPLRLPPRVPGSGRGSASRTRRRAVARPAFSHQLTLFLSYFCATNMVPGNGKNTRLQH